MKRVLPYGQAILATTVFTFLLSTLTHAGEGDLDLRAKLIWATNGDKPNDPRLKEIDPKTVEKLAGVFKWKNYFEVSRTNFNVAVGASRKVTMSPKCDVKVQNLGGSKVEVELIGEGKQLVKKRQAIKAGELVVLAGPDKNDTAWFVILHQHER